MQLNYCSSSRNGRNSRNHSSSIMENHYFSSICFYLICSAVFCSSLPAVGNRPVSNDIQPSPLRVNHTEHENNSLSNTSVNSESPVPNNEINPGHETSTTKPVIKPLPYDNPKYEQTVTLYPRNNHIGTPTKVTLTTKKRCVNVPNNYANKILSVDTAGKCAYLYKKRDCDGKYVQISPGTHSHNRLRDVGLDKKTRSVGVCHKGHNDVY